MTHEWHSEVLSVGIFSEVWDAKGKPGPMTKRLGQLEDEGFEIFDIMTFANVVIIVYRRPR